MTKNHSKVLQIATHMEHLADIADGDFGIRWYSALNRWCIGWEGDDFSNWVQGRDIVACLRYFQERSLGHAKKSKKNSKKD